MKFLTDWQDMIVAIALVIFFVIVIPILIVLMILYFRWLASIMGA